MYIELYCLHSIFIYIILTTLGKVGHKNIVKHTLQFMMKEVETILLKVNKQSSDKYSGLVIPTSKLFSLCLIVNHVL